MDKGAGRNNDVMHNYYCDSEWARKSSLNLKYTVKFYLIPKMYLFYDRQCHKFWDVSISSHTIGSWVNANMAEVRLCCPGN